MDAEARERARSASQFFDEAEVYFELPHDGCPNEAQEFLEETESRAACIAMMEAFAASETERLRAALRDKSKLESYLSSCDSCGAENADNLICDKCFAKVAVVAEFGGEAPTLENGGLGSGIVPSCPGCGAPEGMNHNYECPEAQD